jgi:hypothetical protein
MTHQLKLQVSCPNCKNSLMAPERQIDGLDAIRIVAKVLDTSGDIFLSQVYGSYSKEFGGAKNVEGSVVEGLCPHCSEPFPVHQMCECGAPLFSLSLHGGGLINICSRNGCQRHSLEFENADDAFELFRRTNGAGLF